MYSEPWARFTRSMMPNTSVSPAASRNSSSPNCSPFRHCSTKSSIGSRRTEDVWRTAEDGRREDRSESVQSFALLIRPPSSVARRLTSPLHRALGVEVVLAVLDDRLHGLERQVALGV